MTHQDELKQLVGKAAVQFVEDGMTVGLGTGTTVKFMVDALGQRVNQEHLSIVGVPTSDRTREQANSLGIPTKGVERWTTLISPSTVPTKLTTRFKGSKVAVPLIFGKKNRCDQLR